MVVIESNTMRIGLSDFCRGRLETMCSLNNNKEFCFGIGWEINLNFPQMVWGLGRGGGNEFGGQIFAIGSCGDSADFVSKIFFKR